MKLEEPYIETFDKWRSEYDNLSYEEHCDFYDQIYDAFPAQDYCTLDSVDNFFQMIKFLQRSCRVFEVGGWNGRTAKHCLLHHDFIDHWYNVELCRKVVETTPSSLRYTSQVPNCWVWDMPDFPYTNVLVASHSLEHMRVRQIGQLLDRMQNISYAYVEAPIAESAINYDWTGDLSTHIIEVGWEQLEKLFKSYDFDVISRQPNIRYFGRK